MRILGIDPSPTGATWALLDDEGNVFRAATEPIDEILEWLRDMKFQTEVAIEMPASYGMAVGVEVFETCEIVGRLHQASLLRGMPVYRYYRNTIKLHMCGQSNANDANIRQSLIDRYGPTKELAIGRKATPGPLYGFAADDWAALAVAVTHLDRRGDKAVDIGKELERKRTARADKMRKRAAKKQSEVVT